MKKKEAIRILKNQMDKLKNVSLDENINWRTQTLTYIELIFGKNSNEAIHFKDRSGYLYKENIRTELNIFLNNCTETILAKGVHKEKQDNWFSKLPNWAINLGLPALCFVSFEIGVLFTTNNNSELRKENSELKQQLLHISSDSILNQDKNLKKNTE